MDALTGTAIGWPRTGTFRLADLVGLDVLAHVADNFARTGADAAVPPFIRTMLERRWLGDKTSQGFYRKEKDSAGNEVRLALDWKTLEYRPAARPRLPHLEMAKEVERLPERLPRLLAADPAKDNAARFHWRLLTALWNYAADCLPEIADNAADVDRAMRAGFNWEMGPFQLWDAAGVRATADRMKAAGVRVSPSVERLLAAGDGWYRNGGRECFDPVSGEYEAVQVAEGVGRVADFRASAGVIRQNPGASLVDLGDGVACLELHSIKNAIGEDIIRLVTETLQPEGDAVRMFDAFVITGDAEQFSVGANLMQLLLSIQEGEWDEIDLAVRAFQRMTAAIKFCPRPGGGGAVRFLLRRRRRNGAARGAAAGSRGIVHGPGGDRRRPAAGRRRVQGNDPARGGRGGVDSRRRAERVRRADAGPAGELRDHRHGKGLHLRG